MPFHNQLSSFHNQLELWHLLVLAFHTEPSQLDTWLVHQHQLWIVVSKRPIFVGIPPIVFDNPLVAFYTGQNPERIGFFVLRILFVWLGRLPNLFHIWPALLDKPFERSHWSIERF